MLQKTDILTKVGYSVIGGVNVVRYTCQIPLAKPEGMTVNRTVLDQKLYEQNLDECRSDYAAFEDGAFETRNGLINTYKE